MRLAHIICLLQLGAAAGAAPPALDLLAGTPQSVRMCYPGGVHVNCGFPGMTPQQCSDAGCCWSSANASEPWCYLPNAPASWSEPGEYQAYAANQAAPATASILGAVHADVSGDVAAVSCLSLPPFAQTCDTTSRVVSPYPGLHSL